MKCFIQLQCLLRFLKLYTAYFNAEGILVTAPIKCTVNYFKTNFLLDMLSNFPTEIFSLAIWNGGQLNDGNSKANMTVLL